MRIGSRGILGLTVFVLSAVPIACASAPVPAAPPTQVVQATSTSFPPTSTPTQQVVAPDNPTSTPQPATHTAIPATSTTVPPTATSVPPTNTPTASTSVQPNTPTAVAPPPTATAVPPTSTRVPPTATPIPEPTPIPVQLASEIKSFILEDLTVKVGTTVTWTNEDAAAHTTTSGTPPNRTSGIWDSGALRQGSNFSHTFTEAGEFQYFCKIHPGMMATVIVTEN